MNLLRLFALAGMLPVISYGQLTLTGSVRDQNGEPLLGATVRWKENPTVGTQTDEDGRFSLVVTAASGTLIFSYVGFEEKEVAFSEANTTFHITLSTEKELEEVIVIGYGVQRKSDVTGAIASLRARDIEGLPHANLGTSITGKASGLYIKTPSGTPGAGLLVSVRGSENPLYVVDGIPMLSESNSALATSYDTQGNITGNGQNISSIADINPDDIASIEILKDASSASIYGARAANGVVLITTRRGAAGKTQFHFNAYSGLQTAARIIPFLSSDAFVALVEDARAQDLKKYEENPDYFGPDFDPAVLTTPLPESWFTGVNTNWLDEVLQPAPIASVQLSASGGTERNRYYISNAYFDQQGIVINSYYRRFTSRLNFDQTASERVTFGENLSITYSRNRRSFNDDTYTGIITNALGCSPLMPPYDENGNYSDYTQYQAAWLSDNPILSANEIIAFSNSYRFLGSIYANYTFSPAWALRSSVAADFTYLTDDQFWSPLTADASALGGKAFNGSFKQLIWLNENTLTFSQAWNDAHHLNAVTGFTLQRNQQNRLGITGQGFPPGSNLQTVQSAALITSHDASASRWSLVSFLGRVQYDFRSRYLVSASMRADGSSRFGPDNRFGLFPAASVGWRLSDEPFFPKTNFLSDLKFRLSFGLTGDQEIGDFQYISFWTPVSYNGQAGLGPRNLADPRLRWQSNQKFNAGLDYEFFDGRINGSIEYFRETKYDLLSEDALPGTSGFSSITRNAGRIRNSGFEFQVEATPIQQAVTWQVGFNLSYLNNEVLDLTTDSLLLYAYNDLAPTHILAIGHPQGSFWGVRYLGVDPLTGDPIYDDLNGDGIIDDNDATIIGKALPDYFGGLHTSLRYRNWMLDIATSFNIGNQVYNLIRGEYLSLGYSPEGWDANNVLYMVYSNNSTEANDRWKQPGDQTDIPRASLINSHNYQNSTQNLEDASFWRFNDITLSYVFRQVAGLSRLRLYVQVQNAWVFTRYSGFDPEVSSTGGSDLNTTGVDYAAYPKARTFLFGVNASF
ncbi:MAG: TonB-dependent receptor [Chitinophagales bacterium]|nr:TonB-dependent receptor [Chitinophagales bacterium]MDW8428623.1 TonB-dependent receptor [Chitinophagales bacterium]